MEKLYIDIGTEKEDSNMKNFKKLSAIVITALFASMQVSSASIDTGLGVGNGGAVINNATGGLVDVTTGVDSATLNFNNHAHVNWDTLNVNSGETLNFNAVNGASGLNILNTVSQGMSKIYGQIKTNEGISNIIISNPNGMLFDGATFTTAADTNVNLTTNPMNATFDTNGNMNLTMDKNVTEGVTIQNSDFNIGGKFNIYAPKIEVIETAIKTGKGFKLVTTNGQDFVAENKTYSADMSDIIDALAEKKTAEVKLQAVEIDGDVYIIAGNGVVKTVSGGTIKGNLDIDSHGNVFLNYTPNGKALTVQGDVNAKGDGIAMYARNTKVGGNLNLENQGGFVEVAHVNVDGDMNLKTSTTNSQYNTYNQGVTKPIKHFVHVYGNVKVKGNANIDSKDNIHIGGYNIGKGSTLDGKLQVDGDLTAHSKDGHVMVTIDTSANKIDLKSDNLNVLSANDATLTAKEYKFSSNGYIGGIDDYTKEDGTVVKADTQVISLMENYTFIPKNIKSHTYMNIAGGKVTQINTPKDANVYIASKGNMEITGANTGDLNITARNSRIDITGDNVHANNVNVANDTKTLKVEFPKRDYTLNYTNIKDEKVVTVKPNEEITYELTNAPGGYNNQMKVDDPRDTKTTYLIGPDKDPTPPPPDPNPPKPDDPGKYLTNWTPDDPTVAPVNTPVAYAADLDDDELDKAVRKNVDGSVTVVRAFPMY